MPLSPVAVVTDAMRLTARGAVPESSHLHAVDGKLPASHAKFQFLTGRRLFLTVALPGPQAVCPVVGQAGIVRCRVGHTLYIC